MHFKLKAFDKSLRRSHRAWIALSTCAALIASPLSAQAADDSPATAEKKEARTVEPPSIISSTDLACLLCKNAEKLPSRIRWRNEWPRVTLWEHTLTAIFGAGALAALQLGPHESGRWQNSFDEGIRDALRVDSESARVALTISSDVIFYGLMLYPIVIDTLLVAGVRDTDTAWQMTVMNLQSLAISGATSIGLLRLTGRERPFVRECAADPEYDPDCDNPDQHNVSFTSGHTLMGFAAAGLVCAHHLHLPLYGGGAPDVLACAGALGVAHLEGFLRISVDVHYATDVIAAGVIGFSIGYLIPRLLHYRSGSASVSVAPYAGGNAAGLSAVGAF